MRKPKPAKPVDEPCYMCRGTRVIRYTVSVSGQKQREQKMPCFKCNSTGRLPIGHQAAWDRAQLAWCRCPADDARGAGEFHDDGECAVESKHHWHCPDCGKLQQVG